VIDMIRLALSYVCYGLGDCVWRFGVDAWLGDRFEWPHRLYQRFMLWSSDLQGDDKRGPWITEPDPDPDEYILP
jgi:hypothetical protein